MKTLLQKEESSLPLGKLTLYILSGFLILGIGIQFFLGLEKDKTAEHLYAQAKDHFANSRFQAGLITIEKALKLKETPDYLGVKLNILVNQEKPYEALLVLDKLNRLEPKNAHYYILSGRISYNQGDYEKALSQYLKATELAPDNGQYQVELANLYLAQGKEKEGVTLYKRLIQKDPHYKLAREQYITALSNMNQYTQAIEQAKLAIQQSPSDSDYYFLLASTYDRMGNKKQEAIAAYYRSLELEPIQESIAAERILKLTGKRVPPELENMDTDEITFTKSGNVMFATARVNHGTGTFLLDTGASMGVIYQSKMRDYGIIPSPFKMEAETANGMVQAPIGYASVQMGRHQIDNVVFAILPDPQSHHSDGIIGMNFLGKFRFEFDQSTHKLTLKR